MKSLCLVPYSKEAVFIATSIKDFFFFFVFFFASRSPLTRTDTTDTEMAEEIAFTAIK
jgi:hypothetical protein